jgi:3'(2'), 5'-bisphosphate nucleotidase
MAKFDMQLTQNQLNTLCQIACEAGNAVMAVYRTDFTAEYKADTSPLTEADLRADAIIRQRLVAAFAGVFILSEESTSATAGTLTVQETFFLVDPLDGTKEFLKRSDEFTVNIALIHQGRAIAGVVLAPALGELFYAAIGLGAWKRSNAGTVPLQVAPYENATALRVMGSRSHGTDALAAWLAKLPCQHSFVAAGSSLKFCRIAEGLADVYPRFGPTCQWDTAAAQCVLEVAGGAVTDMQGQRLAYGLDRSVLNPEFMARGHPATTAFCLHNC